MATLLLTARTYTGDLLDEFPDAQSVLAWYGEDPDPGEYQTLGDVARGCGPDVQELLIDLRASLSLSDSDEDDDDSDGEPDGSWNAPEDWSESDERLVVALAAAHER